MSRPVNVAAHLAALGALRAIEQDRRPATPPGCACALTGAACPAPPRR